DYYCGMWHSSAFYTF
nr:immunoglobulin light chain junction region [Macaca mulatta]